MNLPVKPGTARRLSLRPPDRRRACRHASKVDITTVWARRYTYLCNDCQSTVDGGPR